MKHANVRRLKSMNSDKSANLYDATENKLSR